MGLMDKARAAATDLAAKADTALSGSKSGQGATSGDADRYLRDLGVLAYLEADGRPVSAEDRERVMDVLKGMETQGALGGLTLRTSAPPPPGGAVPPPPGGAVPPPPAQSAPTTPAPPPPSWMAKDDRSS